MRIIYKKAQHLRKLEQLKALGQELQFENNKKDAASRLHIPRIVQKIKSLLNELKGLVSVMDMKKVLGPACLILGLSFSNSSSAQVTFLAPVQNTFALTSTSYLAAPAVVDMDNDGDLDMMVGEYGGTIEYFQNTGTVSAPVFAAPVMGPYGLTAVNGYAFPAMADLDNDGDKDMIVGEYGGNLNFFLNTGTATVPSFTTPVSVNPYGLTPVTQFAFPAFVDIDNDGDYDLMVGEYGGSFEYFQNTGTATVPSFTTAAVMNPFGLASINSFATPSFSDVDGDGDKDLMAGESGGSFEYFENTGTVSAPSFTTAAVMNPFSLTSVNNIACPAFADFDNDGDKDLMVGEYLGNFQYFERQNPITTGIAALNAAPGSLNVSPNPATDMIRISGDKASAIVKVEVIDVSGKLCAEYHGSIQTVSLTGLAAGLYTVKISSHDGSYELKKIQKL